MRITRTIATGVFLGWMCQSSLAVQSQLVERPSPPPCCADGQCLASPLTYGYYDTRWRRWPLEAMAQAAPAKPGQLTAPAQRDVQPFVIPPAEQEDRKAPPPSVPAGEQTPPGATSGAPRTPAGPGGATAPQGPHQPGGTGAPGAPGTQQRGVPGYPAPSFPPSPQTVPLTPPEGQGTQPSTQPLFKNVSPDSPLNRSGPMGDSDPPPSLPFGPALVAPEQPTREVSQQPVVLPIQRPSAKPVQSPSSDPPPSLPIALVSYEE